VLPPDRRPEPPVAARDGEDRSVDAVRHFQQRWRAEVAGLVDDELIEEHRRTPVGRHSDRLERVLAYFRKAGQAGKYVIVATDPGRQWAIGVLSGARGEAPALLAGARFDSEAAAQHGVFLRRVQNLLGTAPDARTEPIPAPATVLHGYADRLSARPGDRLRFMVSCEGAERFQADVVDLVDEERRLDLGGFPARRQEIATGSHVVVEDAGRLDLAGRGTLFAFCLPTTPANGRQGLLTRWAGGRRGYGLGIDEGGRLALWLGWGQEVRVLALGRPLRQGRWYAVAAAWDLAAGRAALYQRPVTTSVNSRGGTVEAAPADDAFLEVDPGAIAPTGDPGGPADPAFLIAAFAGRGADGRAAAVDHYNGKIEHPRVYGRALGRDELDALAVGAEPDPDRLLARWDFAADLGPDGVPSTRVTDDSGNGLHGRCVNMPVRAATGHGWTGREVRFSAAPGQYGAIHFHDDDLADAAWEPDGELTVPHDLPSGAYAIRLRAGGTEDQVPFFVPPAAGGRGADIAVLVPTATYMAYANQLVMVDLAHLQAGSSRTPVLDPADVFLAAHREFGLSTYDSHSDGSGNAYSSRLRPILNIRPWHRNQGSLWGLPADLCLFRWLAQAGHRADYLTDEDLHREGVDLLRPYRVVLTGTHPEYTSAAMLDGLEAYLRGGGRLMYLGGNGFYWVISFDPEQPHVLEVRKQGGTRAWQAMPGEQFHSGTGELGGLWRDRGRPPQQLVGIGFTAQGFDICSHYRRLPDSFHPRAGFIFEGVGPDEPIGAFGLVGDGAAGLELDRYDLDLGTPPDTLLLASSEGHTDAYLHVVEEVQVMTPALNGSQDPEVRADMVYFTTPNGGAVFSTGSIAWCSSLLHDGGDNNVARITDNVLRQFVRDHPPP
jgi:N,N-dimethylformamidase